MINVMLATEDALSESIGLRLLAELPVPELTSQCVRRGGSGYLRSKMDNWRQLAHHQIVVILTDLDQLACPLALCASWLGNRPRPAGLLLRVAVREVESWVLADHEAIRRLIGPKGTLPQRPDDLPDPKQYLLKLAKFAPKPVRQDLIKDTGAVASQGIGYNAQLTRWVQSTWNPARAAGRSPSLARARRRLQEIGGLR